jgi:hypothetical protein
MGGAMPAAKPCFALFALDTQRVVNVEILKAFETLEPKPLVAANLNILRTHEAANPKAKKGLYVLHYEGTPVYAGKADKVLSTRLSEHLGKLSSRPNLDVNKLGFRCLYFDVNWSALAHEGPLLEALGLPWNTSGIGGHDPGVGRDKTVLKAEHFDRRFPINPAIPVPGVVAGAQTVATAIKWLFKSLPYLLRVEKAGTKLLPIYDATQITVAASETAESLLGKLVDALGPNWQVTFLCGYVILYEENDTYPPSSVLKFKRGGGPWATP